MSSCRTPALLLSIRDMHGPFRPARRLQQPHCLLRYHSGCGVSAFRRGGTAMPLGWLIYVLVSLIVIILLIQLLVNLLD